MHPSDSIGRGLARRRFLTAGGAGVAIAGLGALTACHPTEATGAFAMNLQTDFGATGDGSTDDTDAIQHAFNRLSITDAGVKGAFLYVPPGEYVLTRTIEIVGFAGVVQGAGVGNTPAYAVTSNSAGLGSAFQWRGPAGIPMFRIRDARHIRIRDLRFVGNDDATPSAGLNFFEDPDRGVGSNEQMVVEDCVFGAWPWNTDGNYTGRIEVGILLDGGNGDNDQFCINRCIFRGNDAGPAVGVSLVNTQSVWGSMNDCVFLKLTTGVTTASRTTMYNPQFNRCGTDVRVRNTARVHVYAWQSENSGRMAAVEPYGGLCVNGGAFQINPEAMTPASGGIIAGFPSASGQTISLEGVRFLWLGTAEAQTAKPTIAFGPKDPYPAGGAGFLVKVTDCEGLHASQCDFRGSMWAAVPERSRGLVEWRSRHSSGIVQFRNELWQAPGPGARATLDVNVWDPPIPGTNN